jgi:DNA-binding MarR family transcriptional regulator
VTLTEGPEATTADDVAWLSSSQQADWRAFASVMLTLPAALDSDMQAKAGISHFDYMVLSRLSESEHLVLRMSHLAALTTSSLSRLSHVVARLERRGWIERFSCPEDGRFTNARLTEAGLAKVVASAPGHVEAVRSMVIDALSPEQLGDLGLIATEILAKLRRYEPTPAAD